MSKLEFNEIHSIPTQIWFQIEQTQNEKQNQRNEYNQKKKKSQIKILTKDKRIQVKSTYRIIRRRKTKFEHFRIEN